MKSDEYRHADEQSVVALYDEKCPNGCPTRNDRHPRPRPRRCCSSLIRNAL